MSFKRGFIGSLLKAGVPISTVPCLAFFNSALVLANDSVYFVQKA